MKRARVVVATLLGLGLVGVFAACADDEIILLPDDAPEASVITPVPDDAAMDALDAFVEASADGALPCSPDDFCRTALPSAEDMDAGGAAPDVPISFDLVDVTVLPDHRAFAVATEGYLLAWDGKHWSATRVGRPLTRVWATTADDLWLGSTAGVMVHATRTPGQPFTFATETLPTPVDVAGVRASSAGDVWAAAGGAQHRERAADGGVRWVTVPHPFSIRGPERASYMSEIWNRGDEVWFGGLEYTPCPSDECAYEQNALVLHTAKSSDGGVSLVQVPFAIDGGVRSEAVRAGALGVRDGALVVCANNYCSPIARGSQDGGALRLEDTHITYGEIESAWASANDDVWLVGKMGLARRWNGTSWSFARIAVGPTPVGAPLHAVSGIVDGAALDMWIVGKDIAMHRVKP